MKDKEEPCENIPHPTVLFSVKSVCLRRRSSFYAAGQLQVSLGALLKKFLIAGCGVGWDEEGRVCKKQQHQRNKLSLKVLLASQVQFSGCSLHMGLYKMADVYCHLPNQHVLHYLIIVTTILMLIKSCFSGYLQKG